MTALWLHANLFNDVEPPLTNGRGNRSPEALIGVVGQFELESAERYRPRDVTGDGKPETFCNYFLHDATRALGCAIPQKLANLQLDWLASVEGRNAGWSECTHVEAQRYVEHGWPVVVMWQNAPGGHGHVALAVPSPDAGLHIAQAGATCFSCQPVRNGFGSLPTRCFAHP